MGFAIVLAQKQIGTGKTTLLAHLARAWSESGASVAVFDYDTRKVLTRWVKSHRQDRVSLLGSEPWHAKTEIRAAKSRHDIILIDCPSFPDMTLAGLVRECDLVVAPVRPISQDKIGAAIVHKTANVAHVPMLALLNRATQPDLKPYRAELAERGISTLTTSLGEHREYASAMVNGFAGFKRDSNPAIDEIAQLRAEIDSVLGRDLPSEDDGSPVYMYGSGNR